jgi:ApaG protein
MFEATTHQIRVRVMPAYVPDQSDPDMNRYFFSYTVEIENQGPKSVQLVSRHWIITDSQGHVEEVKGPGVIGQQPTLEPGQKFEYSSFCPLPTPTGSMQGSYVMVDGKGDKLEVQIPEFLLIEPGQYH